MFLKRHPIALAAACAVVALLMAADPASAVRGGGRGGGGRGGYGGCGGGRRRLRRRLRRLRRRLWRVLGGGGLYRGYLGGYYPGYFGGYDCGYYDNDYSPGVILDTTPSYDYTPSYYYTPPAAVVTPDTTTVPDGRAQVEVRVPAPDAQVFFDGAATQQRGMDRMFISPPLTSGQNQTYSIEARWTENGRPVDMTKSVTVTPGRTATVDFGR